MSQNFALLVSLPQFQGVEQQSMVRRNLETEVSHGLPCLAAAIAENLINADCPTS